MNEIKHSCCTCKYMNWLEDNRGRRIFFCMFDQSPIYLEITGCCGGCSLDEYAEKIYQGGIEE